jgi:hypothetical protein
MLGGSLTGECMTRLYEPMKLVDIAAALKVTSTTLWKLVRTGAVPALTFPPSKEKFYTIHGVLSAYNPTVDISTLDYTKLLSLNELANALHRDYGVVLKAVHRGFIKPVVYVGKARRFLLSDVDYTIPKYKTSSKGYRRVD